MNHSVICVNTIHLSSRPTSMAGVPYGGVATPWGICETRRGENKMMMGDERHEVEPAAGQNRIRLAKI